MGMRWADFRPFAPFPARTGTWSMPRALLSVSDKTGLSEFARGLAALGWELVSTGGTARTLREAGVAVRDISEITGFPEMMDGRVKTLHPKVHGGLLAKRDDPEHMKALEEHGIGPIDLVAVNLYPFRETAARAGTTPDAVIEQIDIGGPSMVRSASKNFASVYVVVDPADYGRVLATLEAKDDDLDLSRIRPRPGRCVARLEYAVADPRGVRVRAGGGDIGKPASKTRRRVRAVAVGVDERDVADLEGWERDRGCRRRI